MVNISSINPNMRDIARALSGRWERKTVNGTTYVILGTIAFVQGDTDEFPYDVIAWHSSDSTGSWGILK